MQISCCSFIQLKSLSGPSDVPFQDGSLQPTVNEKLQKQIYVIVLKSQTKDGVGGSVAVGSDILLFFVVVLVAVVLL